MANITLTELSNVERVSNINAKLMKKSLLKTVKNGLFAIFAWFSRQ
jgi:hypothetical protein